MDEIQDRWDSVVAKWETIIHSIEDDDLIWAYSEAEDQCAVCRKYRHGASVLIAGDGCDACPIFKKAGGIPCFNTEIYGAFTRAFINEDASTMLFAAKSIYHSLDELREEYQESQVIEEASMKRPFSGLKRLFSGLKRLFLDETSRPD